MRVEEEIGRKAQFIVHGLCMIPLFDPDRAAHPSSLLRKRTRARPVEGLEDMCVFVPY